ncbi:MAG: adenosylmethionine decarboxylase [Pseudobdellovibrionaceae bacterium]
MVHLGNHTLIDYFDCDHETVSSSTLVETHLLEAARLIHATVVQTVVHQFNPYGISGVIVIAESHLAIHTWPEFKSAAVDIFTCNKQIDVEPAIRYLAQAFKTPNFQTFRLERGRFAK